MNPQKELLWSLWGVRAANTVGKPREKPEPRCVGQEDLFSRRNGGSLQREGKAEKPSCCFTSGG